MSERERGRKDTRINNKKNNNNNNKQLSEEVRSTGNDDLG